MPCLHNPLSWHRKSRCVVTGVEVGRAVQWGLGALGIPGPPEAGCSSQSPCNGPMVGWQSWGALCDGEQLWLVRVGILVEAGQTLAQVEVSSVWFRGCA